MPGGESLRLAIIIGTRRGRLGPIVAEWFAAKARQRVDLEVDVIDLADAALPEVPTADRRSKPHAVRDLAPWLAAADAFVVVTNEDSQDIPVSLSTAIDWYQDEWKAKPVAFVTYGHSSDRPAVERLRQVFVGLHAAIIRDTVTFHDYWEQFESTGRSTHFAGCDKAANAVLNQLTWWAHTLRSGRAEHPYDA